MSDPFLCNLIASIEEQITNAMLAMADYSGDGIISYTMNTGQTQQTVTKASLKDMQAYVDSLLARRDSLRQRCGLSSASFQASASW